MGIQEVPVINLIDYCHYRSTIQSLKVILVLMSFNAISPYVYGNLEHFVRNRPQQSRLGHGQCWMSIRKRNPKVL